jgi:DNA-binding CsgD family transcriptional regulator
MASGPEALVRAAAAASDSGSLMSAVAAGVRTWVGAGPVFLATADPVTGSFTGSFTYDIADAAAAAFSEIEMSGRDVVSFRELASSPTPIGALFATTGGRAETSVRWREVISPLGWGDELRAAVRGSDGVIWGYLCLHREARDRAFAARDVARLAALLPAVAASMRRASLPWAHDHKSLDTGVLLVDSQQRVIGATGAAQAWLDELAPLQPGGLPLLLAGLARSVMREGHAATSTVVTRGGLVAAAHADVIGTAGEPSVVVLLSCPSATQRLDRLALAASLTARESAIVDHVLQGLPTRAIADELGISPHTVQAHLTSVFNKTGLRSRRDLVSRLRL